MQPIERPSIVFFREAKPDDRFERAFSQAGFETRFIAVLRTELLAPPASVSPVDAVVVTSARAADAIKDWDLLESLDRIPWFAVGEATREALDEIGVAAVGRVAGSARELANLVLEAGVGRALFLAGDPHRPELPQMLRRGGVEVETGIVYRTCPNELDLSGDPELPDWVALFSPRGVQIVAESTGEEWNRVAKAAIGPTTARVMGDLGWPPDAVAASPTAESLLAAIRSASTDLPHVHS